MKADRNRGKDNAQARELRNQKLAIQKAAVRRLHGAELTDKEIAARLKMDWRTVAKIREEHGLTPNPGSRL